MSAVSTGQAQIRPDHLASPWRPTPWRLLASRHWTGPRPVNAYVTEHRDGLVLFDAGQDRASVTGPGYFPGDMTGGLHGRLARFAIDPQQTLTVRLDRLGLRWHRIEPELSGDPGLAPFRSCHDLFGDSSLVILPARDPAAASRLVHAVGQVPTLTTA